MALKTVFFCEERFYFFVLKVTEIHSTKPDKC